MNRLWIPLVVSEALLERERVKVKVKRHPSETKRALWSDLSKQPLTSTSNDVSLAVSGAERVANSSSKHCRKKVSLRLYRGGGFKIVFRQKLVGGITHTGLILQ